VRKAVIQTTPSVRRVVTENASQRCAPLCCGWSAGNRPPERAVPMRPPVAECGDLLHGRAKENRSRRPRIQGTQMRARARMAMTSSQLVGSSRMRCHRVMHECRARATLHPWPCEKHLDASVHEMSIPRVRARARPGEGPAARASCRQRSTIFDVFAAVRLLLKTRRMRRRPGRAQPPRSPSRTFGGHRAGAIPPPAHQYAVHHARHVDLPAPLGPSNHVISPLRAMIGHIAYDVDGTEIAGYAAASIIGGGRSYSRKRAGRWRRDRWRPRSQVALSRNSHKRLGNSRWRVDSAPRRAAPN